MSGTTAGKFITFEGGEGSGKSTQARRLASRLQKAGIPTVLTREPGGSPFAERVRALLLDPTTPAHGALAEALLFYAARADHLDVAIRPALAAGAWVICDRFADSTHVYQGYAGDVPAATLAALEQAVVAPTRPDLTFIIDMDVAEGLARAHARRAAGTEKREHPDRFEGRDLSFHQALRRGFHDLTARNPDRYRVIDGSGNEDDVGERVWTAATRVLGLA
jgi:dTMP kinase